jgi:hypothetical protein
LIFSPLFFRGFFEYGPKPRGSWLEFGKKVAVTLAWHRSLPVASLQFRNSGFRPLVFELGHTMQVETEPLKTVRFPKATTILFATTHGAEILQKALRAIRAKSIPSSNRLVVALLV